MTDALIQEFLSEFDESHYPGDFLQQYELMECLANHEIGETLLVKDRETGVYSVAKCYLDPSPFSHTRESDLLKNLHHKGLPAFIAEYHNEGMTIVVREYIRGLPLDQFVKGSRPDAERSTAMVAQLCDLLTYLHSQTPPIIHRDIKPENIIVDDHGDIHLIDFGISRIYNESTQADTAAVGTRHYAAPEQYGFLQTDQRSDIYSLGVLLCWLLTRSVNVQQAKEMVPNARLASIVAKCTAFAPRDRYQSAAQVRDALTGRAKRRGVRAYITIALILLTAVLLFVNFPALKTTFSGGVTFSEPLVEKAVRMQLNKNDSELVTPQDLLKVNELLIFGDHPAANEEDFRKANDRFVRNDGSIQRGSIRRLNDLAKLKNLRKLYLAYQNISDLAPLSSLANLEYVDLHHNPVADVSPLSGNTALQTLILFDTNVTDLTVLGNCPRLTMVDIGLTPIRSLAALDGLTTVRILMLRKGQIQSLDTIQNFTVLEEIYLSQTSVVDLSPLLALPRLRLVEVD
ncbi:MAG: protein kinase, partial [Anaerolineaceae bacterium]|nr:protein kinase [Anaerolineaceae bacterium]